MGRQAQVVAFGSFSLILMKKIFERERRSGGDIKFGSDDGGTLIGISYMLYNRSEVSVHLWEESLNRS